MGQHKRDENPLPCDWRTSALAITRLAQSFGPAISPTITVFLFLHAGGTTTEVVLAVVFLTCGVMALGILSVLNRSRHSS